MDAHGGEGRLTRSSTRHQQAVRDTAWNSSSRPDKHSPTVKSMTLASARQGLESFSLLCKATLSRCLLYSSFRRRQLRTLIFNSQPGSRATTEGRLNLIHHWPHFFLQPSALRSRTNTTTAFTSIIHTQAFLLFLPKHLHNPLLTTLSHRQRRLDITLFPLLTGSRFRNGWWKRKVNRW